MNVPTVPMAEIAAPKGLVGGPFGSSLGSRDYVDDGVPVIRGTNLSVGKMVGGEFVYVSPEKADGNLVRNQAVPGDLVFTQRGTLGQVALVPDREFDRYIVSQSQMRLRVEAAKACPEYVFYACSSAEFVKQILDNAIATGVPHINLGILQRLEIPCPPVHDQRAIAEVLGALDDKIAANRKLADRADELATAMFVAAAMRGNVERSLSDVSLLITRGGAPKYTEDDDGFLVLNQRCIRDGRVDLQPARRTRLQAVRPDRILKNDDVLVNSTGVGTLGRVSRWIHPVAATVDSHVSIVRFDREIVDPVCAGFAMLQIQRQIEMMGEGSTGQTELSREQLGKLRIRFLEGAIERQISAQLTELSELSRICLLECDTLAALRDTLLPRLMSGELRVKDAEAVVADAV